MHATNIATGAPGWVYILLAALVALGIRRLKTRETPLLVALIPSAAFLIWSVVGASAFAAHTGVALAVAAWVAGALCGGASGVFLPEPRGERLANGRVRQPGSWLPLILYICVFLVRYACGAWGAIVPAQANMATAIGIAVGAAMTARLVIGVIRWRAVPAASPARA
ncbi:MAG TPA: DUF6622 family protein [Allosphingosinicella sp.]|jgi:uncharacterized membrane protein